MSGFFVSTAYALTTLTVASPNNGTEEWRGIQNITWTSTGGVSGDLVDIALIDEIVGFSQLIAEDVPYSATPFSWDSGTGTFADRANAKIRVLQANTSTSYDTSDAIFTLDNTAPVTALATTTGTLGLNGYYMGPSVPTFDLNCTDALSGCLETYYQLDGGGYLLYSGTFAIPNGVHTLEWFSRDQAVNAGGFHNTEATHSQVIKVDTVVPTVAVTSSTLSGAYNVPDAINVTLTFNEDVTTTDTITVTLETGATDRTCIVPIMTNATVGTCTYNVQAGDTSADLTTNSIAATMGSVLDIAGNTANLSPTSNLADTSAIVVDTTAPSAFTTGAVTTTGGTIVSGWWNSTNATTTVEVPFAVDTSLTAGVMQLQAEADGTFQNVGSAWEIFPGYLGSSVAFPITAAELEALTGFTDGDNITFQAIITDLATNSTTGSVSATSLNVDQEIPTVDAGTNKEVNASVTQDATTSDGGSSGLNTHLWTSHTNVNFTSASTEDTDISATGDGTYTLTLTVTDNAGNSNSDTMTFVWDTTAPVLAQVTAVTSPTNDQTPSYTFSSTIVKHLVGSTGEVILYSGLCKATPTTPVVTNNTITLEAALGGNLTNGTYTDCDLTVTDAAGNTSATLQINDFEVDTIAAVTNTAGITTTDTNTNGKIDTVTIVFDDPVDDSTFLPAHFTVGGIVPTSITSGLTVDDNTIVLNMGTEVDGTQAKTVVYTVGTALDLAGNAIASFSIVSTDLAKPVLLSARTIDTTHVTATFSEDLDGNTVNSVIFEFTVAGFAVSGASETSAGVVTLTVATMPTDATPNVTYTEIDSLRDLAPVWNTAVTPTTVTAVDGVASILTSVSIYSNNAKDGTAWAKEGNTVTVSFTASEQLHTNTTVTIGNESATITDLGSNNWTATLVMDGDDTEGAITFTINFEDVATPTHNTGTPVTTVTDATEITYDRTAPSVDAGTTPRYINIAVTSVNQGGSVMDGGSGVDLTETLWTQTAGPGIATPTPNNTENTVLTADTDGTYTMQLFGEDNAGNSATDTMTLVRDTVSPFVKTYSPTTGKVNVPVTAGTATVTFNENIGVLNASGATIFKDSDESSVANGTASVSGGNDATAILELPYVTLGTGTIYRFNVNPNAVRDTAGNPFILSFANHFYTVADETAPVIDLPTVTGITATGATLSVTTNEAATCSYSNTDKAYSAMTAMTTTGGTLHSVAITGLIADTSYNYYVRCADTSPAVNVTDSSTHLPFKTSNVPDTTVPTPIITTAGTTVNSNTYIISGTIVADMPTDGIRTISVYNGGSSAGSASVPFGQTVWSVVVSLTQNATSTFSATASDVAGNVSGSSNTVDIGDADSLDEDSSAPVAPIITTTTATVDNDTYEITGTSADDGVRTIVVENGGSPAGTVVLPVGETVWAVTVSLSQNTDSTFTAYAYDEAGNKSLVSNSVTITDATPTTDVTAPFISNIRTSGITQTSATIEWETDEISTSVVEYGSGTELSYGTTVIGTGVDGVTHSVTLTGLTANTNYHFRVTSADTTGNTSTSLGNLVKTAMDDTATLAVTGISITKSYATDDDTFPNGWSWTFLVTVPTAETEFAMKFDNFVSGTNTILATNNIRYYTAQASANAASTTAVTIAGANTYPGIITLDDDLDAGKAGRQIAVTVEMKVPAGSAGGSYSASYGVKAE